MHISSSLTLTIIVAFAFCASANADLWTNAPGADWDASTKTIHVSEHAGDNINVRTSITVNADKLWSVAFDVKLGEIDGSMHVALLQEDKRIGWMGADAFYKYESAFIGDSMPVSHPMDKIWHHFEYIGDGHSLTLFYDGAKAGQIASTLIPDSVELTSSQMEVSVRNFSVRTDSEYFSTVLKDAGILLSSAPGNLWITGNPEAFVLTGGKPTSAVHVTVTDYWGATVFNKQIQASDNGTLAISISLPPLPPGWYSLGCSTDSNLAAQCCFGVVLRPGSAGNIQAGKVCADAAAAWAIDPSQFAEFAHIVKVIGLPMVRERMHWREVEPQRGEFTWGRYDKLINDYASRGIAVDEIVPDDIPDWAKDDSKTGEHKSPNADDLRNFCLEASQHFRGKITAWEMWNEPDISRSFYDGSPERFLDFTTIAYQALKEGSNSSATVLLGSMCWPHVKPFARDLFVMGAAKYTDAFNWHTYEPYESYSSILGDYRHQCNLGDMPSWMTEAGIFLGTRPNGELSPEDARRQCEYVPKSITRSLASGNSRHFYFILAVSVQ